MDMLPPQAPPAITRNVHQEATAAFDRLVGLQAWLATEQAAIPSTPEVIDAGSLPPFLDAITAYWNAPSTDGTPRRTALADRIAVAAYDLGQLARQDGNMDDAALATIRQMTSAGPSPLPAHIRVSELMFGDVAYAGTLLVQDDQAPERVLAFSVEQGWESFPDTDTAYAALGQRARRTLTLVHDLPGMAHQDASRVTIDTVVSSRDVATSPFVALTERMIDVQRSRLNQAWFEFLIGEDGQQRNAAFADNVFDALRLDQMLDVSQVLAVRHAALIEAFNEQRLTRVPVQVASDWREAEAIHQATLDAVTFEDTNLLSAPLSLAEYATGALRDALNAQGVTQDPADIRIRIDPSNDPAAYLGSLQALFEGTTPSHISLIELACQNVAAFDLARLSAQTIDGQPIPALDDATIRRIIRAADLHTHYRAYTDTTFRSGPDAPLRRNHAVSMQQAHMFFLAQEARLSYYLDDASRSFLPDRSERGYQWIKAVLDHPAAAGRARVEGHEIVVNQMTYLETPLRDVLAISVRDARSVGSVVLYTPDAPDGITFREFADRAEAGRRFFYHPAFREYLLDRLPADFAQVLPNGVARAFAGDNLANWVLGSGSDTAYTKTQAPFSEREVSGDFLDAAYNVEVQLALRNIHTLTRSAEQAQWSWLVDRYRTGLTARIVEDTITSIASAPARAAQAAWRFYDNVKAGDDVQAFVDFADFYSASLTAAAPVYALSTPALAHSITGARFQNAGRLAEARPAVQPVVVFESRFAAKGVRRTGDTNRAGVFTSEGKHYIEHGGQVYAVRYDADYGTWRLTRPNGGAAFRGPAIQRTATGGWAHNRVGLRGGTGRGEGRIAVRRDVYDEFTDEMERAFPDPHELDVVHTQMQRELLHHVPAQLSETQRHRWHAALNAARHRLGQAQPAHPLPPQDLSGARPVAEVPRGYTAVRPSDVPEELWYYGSRPFRTSALHRTMAASNHGFRPNWAAIDTESLGMGQQGIRLSTVPPTSPLHLIRSVSAGPVRVRIRTFAVRINARRVLARTEPSGAPYADLLRREGGEGHHYLLRTNTDRMVNLYRGEHEVLSSLPAEPL
ncbi:hypothetical protein FHW69_000033 [Luteibacter sp. Sphag1AF]|uniref:DUF6543 domain-containing protein n=1 Tax=Luteibacter sp. Sphag1AF TaxID=2587031 RepID=UPI00161E582A|nr:DUF6543 domain-containing protein [Luteibacter sp. Sphag1AF]MBB3225443.1 hypothetical protein [Luteibacter sp. Sphag1AF]